MTKNNSHSFEVFFIDLDDTVYDRQCGLWEAIKERMLLYMREVIGLDWENISAARQSYLKKYGSTMKGLQAEYGINKYDYLAYVHDLPLHEYLQPDPELEQVLNSFSQRKIIFTGADAPHAERVLKTLGLRDCFEKIIDIHTTEPYCKPYPEAFKSALSAVNMREAHKCVMIDDLPQNLGGAQSLGMFAIHVSNETTCQTCDACIHNLKDLRQVFTE